MGVIGEGSKKLFLNANFLFDNFGSSFGKSRSELESDIESGKG